MANLQETNSGEVRGEGREYFANDMVVNLREDFNHRLPRNDRCSLGERYANGRIEIHVHFLARVDGLDGESGHFCAAFYKPLIDTDDSRTDGCVTDFGGVQKHAAEGGDGGVQEAVSIEACKLVEFPEGVVGEGIASLVRLQFLNSCLCAWSHTSDAFLATLTEHSRPHPGLSLPTHVPEDRELNLIRSLVGQRSAMGDGQPKSQEIQTGAEIVQAIPNGAQKTSGLGALTSSTQTT